MSRICLIGCGGAGINSIMDMRSKLDGLSGSFAKLEYRFLDTTDKTIQGYPDFIQEFKKIESKRISGEDLDGMGGERVNRDTAIDIDKNIKEYVDTLPVNKSTYYIIIASGAGASGSLIGPLLTKALLSKKANVVTVVAGDSSNILNINNTINTIATYQKIVTTKGPSEAALSMIFYNNTVDGNTTPATEKLVNNRIYKMVVIMAMACSGHIQNIDHQDMNYFFRASNYRSLDIDPGLYTIGVSVGTLDDPATILARTIISSENESLDIKIPLAHNKVGIAASDFGQFFKDWPIYLLLRRGIMKKEVEGLKSKMAEMEAIRKAQYESFESADRSVEDDDLGLVL